MIKNFFKIFYSKTRKNNHKIIRILFFKFKIYSPDYNRPVVVFIGTNGIGDYLFYRPFFKYIRKSEKYKNAYLIFIMRDIYADFVNRYDNKYFDEIISFNWKEYHHNIFYKMYLNNKINSYAPDVSIDLCGFFQKSPENRCEIKGLRFLRQSICFEITKNIKAKTKIINLISNHEITPSKCKYFNKIIYSDNNRDFEAERVRKFFEELLEIKIPPEKILSDENKNNKKQIAISIIAQSKKRMYSQDKWIEIINNITDKTDNNTELLFLGAKHDYPVIQNLIDKLKNPAKCKNVAGEYLISQIPDVLRNCEFLLSVESGNVHIAHLVGCKTICVSGSASYKRFHPYPDDTVTYVYPPPNMEEMYRLNPEITSELKGISVNEIKPESVIAEIDKRI